MALASDFKHAVKRDKNGDNPATTLLLVLFMHLVSLVKQHAVLFVEKRHSNLTLDELIGQI